MAEEQPPPPARTRKKPATIATMPFRHHPRIIRQKPLRFMDLAPELRNNIYSFALKYDTDEPLDLTGQIPRTTLSLMHLSRAVRTESLGFFYSENIFALFFSYFSPSCLMDPYRLALVNAKIRVMERWVSVWGELAAPHLRSLSILHYEQGSWTKLFIDTTEPVTPVSLQPVVEGSKPDSDGALMAKTEFNSLVLSVLTPQGELELTVKRLCVLMTALQLVASCARVLSVKRKARLVKQITPDFEEQEMLAMGMYQRRLTNEQAYANRSVALGIDTSL